MDDGVSSMTEDADDNHDDGIDKTLLTLLESESESEMSRTEDMSGMNAGVVLSVAVSQIMKTVSIFKMRR